MTDRRTFLKGTAAVGALAAISDMDSLFAQEAGASAASGIPDLVAVRNGTRAEMVRKAVDTLGLSLIHISEPTRLGMISYAVFCLKKKKKVLRCANIT